jgi:ketosteroid isomerase-like protein
LGAPLDGGRTADHRPLERRLHTGGFGPLSAGTRTERRIPVSGENVELIRRAYEAYAKGDVSTMLSFVDPDLEWTYLDPSFEDPEPQVCHGRHELEEALERRAGLGLTSELEEVLGSGEQVMVAVRTPGLDAHRVRKADDRNFSVFTIREGRIIALRDCRDRQEATAIAGIG